MIRAAASLMTCLLIVIVIALAARGALAVIDSAASRPVVVHVVKTQTGCAL